MKKLLYVIGIVVVFIIGVSLGHRLSTIETERSCQAVIETQKNIEASRSRGMQKAQFDRGYWMGVSDDKQCQQLHFQDACDRVNGKADRGFEQWRLNASKSCAATGWEGARCAGGVMVLVGCLFVDTNALC